MKNINKLILFLSLLLTACAPSARDAESALKDLLQEKGFEQTSCTLVATSTNEYEGFVSFIIPETPREDNNRPLSIVSMILLII